MNDNEAPRGGDCVGKPTEWWFPYYYLKKRQELVEIRQKANQAKEICGTCAIQKDCLDYSLKHEPWGIWGGFDEQERALLRVERDIKVSRIEKITITGVGSVSTDSQVLKNRIAKKISQLGEGFFSENFSRITE